MKLKASNKRDGDEFNTEDSRLLREITGDDEKMLSVHDEYAIFGRDNQDAVQFYDLYEGMLMDTYWMTYENYFKLHDHLMGGVYTVSHNEVVLTKMFEMKLDKMKAQK